MVQAILGFFSCRVCKVLEAQIVDLQNERNYYRDKLFNILEAQHAVGEAPERSAPERTHYKPVATHPTTSWNKVRSDLERKHSVSKPSPEDEKAAYWKAKSQELEQQLPELNKTDAAAIEKELAS